MKKTQLFSIIFCLSIVFYQLAAAGPFVAYSMNEAKRQLQTGQISDELTDLGGITDIAGMVYDRQRADFIIVGQQNYGKPRITLDDFVVAMRAVFIHGEYPLVSIDKTVEAAAKGKQVIHMEGGIENTKLGNNMLQADILLKNLALGTLSREIWGVRSYASMIVDQVRNGKKVDQVGSRFWFTNLNPSMAIREDVFVIMEMDVGVETEVLHLTVDGKRIDNPKDYRDEIGDEFTKQVKLNFADLSAEYPVLAQARPILALVSLSEGMRSIGVVADIDFWLFEYSLPIVETSQFYDLLTVNEDIESKNLTLTLSGGFELNPIVIKLKKGYISALKEVVLDSRPGEKVLLWHPPLHGWHIPGTEYIEADPSVRPDRNRQGGCYIDRRISRKGETAVAPNLQTYNVPPPNAACPTPSIFDRLPPQSYSNIGGVMLHGAASPDGGEATQVDLANGGFSIIVGGEGARLDPEVFRKFITVLWSVYYGKDSPGISLDPIGSGIEKHAVRYIGNVINNDLGRVMREADYTMKKWAVGTARPNIPGFKDVDDLSAATGMNYLGASRRFWFVPEDMRFTRSDGMLLFNKGRMTLKTEYVYQNKSEIAEPADLQFAEFFTANYSRIAGKHPIYSELFQYAKLVSLAQYLKANGVPLFWFLMANKDLILMEDSPGVVDELVKESQHFQNFEIRGGVNLEFTEAQYVYDSHLIAALDQALLKHSEYAFQNSPLSEDGEACRNISKPYSFDWIQQMYTVVPQHSLTSGRDSRGIRYQTDLCLRQSGQPGLELTRFFNAGDTTRGEFGVGWNLLIPYRIEPVDNQKFEFKNVSLPKQLALENMITGQEEVLTFSEDGASAVGYVADSLDMSQVEGLFLMTDATFRLVDKLRNEFQFDQAGQLTDMYLGDNYHVHYEFCNGLITDFIESPLMLHANGEEHVEFLNALAPRKLKLTNIQKGNTEVFVFNPTGDFAGYLPEDPTKSSYQFLALLSDGSLRLLSDFGHEIAFGQDGCFEGVVVSRDQRIIRSISQGGHELSFDYGLDGLGNVRIAGASLSDNMENAQRRRIVKYQYDSSDKLCQVVREEDIGAYSMLGSSAQAK